VTTLTIRGRPGKATPFLGEDVEKDRSRDLSRLANRINQSPDVVALSRPQCASNLRPHRGRRVDHSRFDTAAPNFAPRYVGWWNWCDRNVPYHVKFHVVVAWWSLGREPRVPDAGRGRRLSYKRCGLAGSFGRDRNRGVLPQSSLARQFTSPSRGSTIILSSTEA
jgi:hypothetical protein